MKQQTSFLAAGDSTRCPVVVVELIPAFSVKTNMYAHACRPADTSSPGLEAASGSADDMLCIWRLSLGSGGQPSASTTGATALGEGPAGVGPGSRAWSLAADPAEGAGRCGTLRLQHQVKLPQAGVGDVAYRQDGKLLAVSGWDGKVGQRTLHPKTDFALHQCIVHIEIGV